MSRARKHDYKGIAALGRGEDTMLVHMTPREVQSLQGIASAHGGSLTINPETGYPEAGWLSSILPMVAAGVLAATGAGAPAAAAIMAATSAGATKLDGGSWMDALKAGAISGVGSAATAGLTGGLGQAGTSAPGALAPEVAKDVAANNTGAIAGNMGEIVPQGLTSGGREAAFKGANAGTGYYRPLGSIADATGTEAAKTAASATTNMGSAGISRTASGVGDYFNNLGARTSQNVGDMGTGIKNLFNAKDYSAYPGGGSKLLQHSVGTLSPVLTAGLAGELSGTQKDKTPKNKSPYEPYVGPYTMQRPSGGPTEEELAQYYASNNTGDINYFPGQNTFTSPNGPSFTHYAEGGIASLPGPQESAPGAVEGMLSGPGDGMSDSIPANIDGKQEARLADGEFVLPADVVSHIGNGSSKSGSQRLYAMMDAIREARTGNPDQGKQINPNKFLPA
jgi:hypothetical protein